MVEVMKTMVTSFKRSHACTATLSAPNSAAGHHRPAPLLETPGHSQASLGQSLVGSLLLSPGSWCTRFCLGPPRVCFPVLCKFWWLYGRVNGNLLHQMAYAIPTSAAPRSPAPAAGHCWPVPPQKTLRHSLSQSLWDLWVLVHTSYVWALWASLAGMGFDSKRDFAPPSILLGLLLCRWMWGFSSKSLHCHTGAAPAPHSCHSNI